MDLSVRSGEMKYEVVCTKNYLDVGLLIKKDGTKPKKYYLGIQHMDLDHVMVGLKKLNGYIRVYFYQRMNGIKSPLINLQIGYYANLI